MFLSPVAGLGTGTGHRPAERSRQEATPGRQPAGSGPADDWAGLVLLLMLRVRRAGVCVPGMNGANLSHAKLDSPLSDRSRNPALPQRPGEMKNAPGGRVVIPGGTGADERYGTEQKRGLTRSQFGALPNLNNVLYSSPTITLLHRKPANTMLKGG